MNISGKGVPTSDKKLISAKATSLNPNAAEFIPFALKSPSGSSSTAGTSKFANTNTSTLGKAVLDRSESSASNNSDDEAHQYWRRQLPDDITPDFKVMGEDDSHGINSLPFSSLSLTDITEASRFSGSTGSGLMLNEQQELSPHQISGANFSETTSYSISPFPESAASTNFHLLPGKPWDKQLMNNGQFLTNPRDGPLYNGSSRHGFLNDGISKQPFVENTDTPLEFLSSKFPGFAAENLAEVYYASGCNLGRTIDMLTQLLELQVDGGLNQNLNSNSLSASYLSALDFPAPYVTDNQNTFMKYTGDDTQQNMSPYIPSDKDNTLMFRSGSSIPSRGAVDFASTIRKMAYQDPSIWKYDRNGLADASVGSSRNSNAMVSSYNGNQSRGFHGDRLQSRGSTHPGPVWLETGDAVANMYSDIREEAPDHTHLRAAYLEQARQANLIGHKALAKEWGTNGQLHNMQINAVHGKPQESIFRLRNQEIQASGRGQERIIDLHGLGVTEALLVLKRELAGLRNAVRSADQQLQVFISVGTGHLTKGTRTPVRLPFAVQCYLLEEGLDYSEPQPGLLRVVMY